MGEIEVSIVRLPPMRVATVRAISQTPERDAWEQLRAWAEPAGWLADSEAHPVFGFNNPNPSPDRPEYGYEFWIRIGPETVAGAGIGVEDFPGGLYAVTSCKLESGVPEAWKKLWDWVQASEYRWRDTHELERIRNPLAAEEDLVLDLYLPIQDWRPDASFRPPIPHRFLE